jgi:monomeric sarcosine oxidase
MRAACEAMSTKPSVIVVGGGTMGLASAWALARRGAAVTVLERFGHVHDRGSHGGHTRITRQAYHEGSSYVPLVQQADREWLALGRRAEQELLRRTGLLLFGPPDDPELRAAIDTCRTLDLPHELLPGDEARARWPFAIPRDYLACFDPSGGYLRVRPCLDALAQEARDAGAELRYGVQVTGFEHGEVLRVVLADGTRLPADRVVVAAGAWLPTLVPALLPHRLVRQRRILAWTTPAPAHRAALAAMPVWGAFLPDGFFYGFPYGDEGITGLKLAVHTSSRQPWLATPVDPDAVDRQAHPADLDPLQRVLAEHLPQGLGPFTATQACLYTNSPSMDFVIDRLQFEPRIVVAGAFSGHGFKLAPAVGLHVAALLLDDAAPHPELAIATHEKARFIFPHEHVAHLPRAVLAHAARRALPGPTPLQAAPAVAEALARLSPAEAEVVHQFGQSVWSCVCAFVYDVSDPAHVGSPRERAGYAKLRKALPFLDQATFDVLWGVAFRHAMM